MRSDDVDERWPDLLRRAQGGDDRAFAVVWRRHHPGLVRYLEIMAGRDGAEDLAAETWISVVRSLPRFRGEEQGFKAFLFTTARSRLVDGARRAQARPQVTADLDGLDGPARAGNDGVGAALERAEATQTAMALIARLPPGQAEVVALRVVAGFDNAEVARLTGKQQGAVRVAYSRGLSGLAAMLGEAGRVTDPDEPAFR